MNSLTRRTALAAGVVPFLGAIIHSSESETSIRLGCQTNAWPIKPSDPQTLFAALDSIRKLNFTGFETGFANILPLADQPNELKQHSSGLTRFGVHIFRQQYDAETSVAEAELVAKVIRTGSALGFERIILSGAPAADTDARQRKAAALNRYGQLAKKSGMKLAYHNHGPEFKGGQPEIEALLAQTDPALVWHLLDAGHAFRAGADIVAYINRYHQRLCGLHLRDFKDGRQVPLGQGDFPLSNVARALQRNHWSGWVLAEEEREDGSKPGDAAAAPAFAALKKAFGVKA